MKQSDQIELFCVECKAKECDEQSILCVYRLRTNPNWIQKRKILNERKKVSKLQNAINALLEKQDKARKWAEIKI